jgi:hypothetical protein
MRFRLTFLFFLGIFSDFLLVLLGVFHVDGEEFLVKMIVFDFAINNSFIVGNGFTWSYIVIEDKQNIAFDLDTRCSIGKESLILSLAGMCRLLC